MAKKIVVINDWYGEDLKAEMRKAAEKAGFDIAFYETQEEAADAVADAEVIYGFPNRILSGSACRRPAPMLSVRKVFWARMSY